MEQLSAAGYVSYRAMMGEYVIYYRDKVIGGIYDDRFLIKPTSSAKEMMPDAVYELPYEGSKKMLGVVELENPEFLKDLLPAVYDELPVAKPKEKKTAK